MNRVIGLPPRTRHVIIRFLEQLAGDPFQRGNFQEKDVHDRWNEVQLVGTFLVSFYADHAAREVQVVDLEPL
jgi:hypothetical protein